MQNYSKLGKQYIIWVWTLRQRPIYAFRKGSGVTENVVFVREKVKKQI